MMDYKRLTKTNANYEEFMERVTGQKMSYLEYAMKVQKGEKVEMSWATLLHMIKMHQRLAELEDKIENGTLIELPCKVGDTVYGLSCYRHFGGLSGKIFKGKVIAFYIERGLYIRIEAEHDNGNFYLEYGKEVFFTREEAEKKLEELQNG